MNKAVQSRPSGTLSSFPLSMDGDGLAKDLDVETELARYLPHFKGMSEQLKQTSKQIESSVVRCV